MAPMLFRPQCVKPYYLFSDDTAVNDSVAHVVGYVLPLNMNPRIADVKPEYRGICCLLNLAKDI